MSQYTSIYVRKEDTFIEIACRSRNSILSEMLYDDAPYGKVQKLTPDRLNDLISIWIHRRDEYKDSLKKDEESIKTIGQFNNSLDEKLERIAEIQEFMQDKKERLEEVQEGITILYFLLASDANIYIGVECPEEITKDKIVGEE